MSVEHYPTPFFLVSYLVSGCQSLKHIIERGVLTAELTMKMELTQGRVRKYHFYIVLPLQSGCNLGHRLASEDKAPRRPGISLGLTDSEGYTPRGFVERHMLSGLHFPVMTGMRLIGEHDAALIQIDAETAVGRIIPKVELCP